MLSMTASPGKTQLARALRRHLPTGSGKSSFSEGDRVKPRRNAQVDYAVPRGFSAATAEGTVVEEIDSLTVRVKWDNSPAMAKGSVLNVGRIEEIPTTKPSKKKR